jgi:Ca2+-transporting ATPase
MPSNPALKRQMEKMRIPDKPWLSPSEKVLEALEVSAEMGLGPREVQSRRMQFGSNRIRQARKERALEILVRQFRSLVIGLLAGAAVLSFSFSNWVEGIAIVVAILINGLIGFVTELRAVRSVEALKELSTTTARVRRNGNVEEVKSKDLVPGDMVLIEEGDIVGADVRLLGSSMLRVDESALTGESAPVSKSAEPLSGEVHLAERVNMLYKGTAVTTGGGEAVVTATGKSTELGHISSMVEEAVGEGYTPLERRLNRLGHRLVWVTLALVGIMAAAGILSGKEVYLMVEMAIVLAVAAIPEGLPIVATVALAQGMWRMARRSALARKLSAVETLGSTNVICVDKTGTLTENRMTVEEILLPGGRVRVERETDVEDGVFIKDEDALEPLEYGPLRMLLETGALCNNASLENRRSDENLVLGDPTEVALLSVAEEAGIDRGRLLDDLPEVREEVFDPEMRMMATYHELGDGCSIAVKGAPESVIEVSTSILSSEGPRSFGKKERHAWRRTSDRLAEGGLRVLALAQKHGNLKDEPYENLTFLGIVGILDPPRPGVASVIEKSRRAGIRVTMVTGDQMLTARYIGGRVGLTEDGAESVVRGDELREPAELRPEERSRLLESSVFARVTPRQKLNLVKLHQENGAVVAMTGDGVNDAPALEKADIGVAMGKRGTQVAREAADMVLRDDSFSTIVAAVELGRAIFENIRKFTVYLLSGNIGEIITVSLVSLTSAPMPLKPLQILYLNVVNDVFPALALGVGKADADLMHRKARNPAEPILTRGHWWRITGFGALIAGSCLGAFAISIYLLKMSTDQTVTVSFMTLAFARLWHVFNMRGTSSSVLSNEITKNPFILCALFLCAGLLVAAVYVPGLSSVLKTAHPGARGWVLILGMSFLPLLAGQIIKVALRRRKPES